MHITKHFQCTRLSQEEWERGRAQFATMGDQLDVHLGVVVCHEWEGRGFRICRIVVRRCGESPRRMKRTEL